MSEYDPAFIILDLLFAYINPILDKLEEETKSKYMDKYPKTQIELKRMSLYTIYEIDDEDDAYDSIFDEWIFV